MKSVLISGLALIALGGAGLSGCATISEDKCLAGNWQELGYRDGSNGVKRDKASKIADICVKYGVEMDFDAYISGFERGLPNYCTYERGFALGENGSSYNQLCAGPLAVDFAPGYDEGRAVYEVYKEHKSLISIYESKLDDIAGVRGRLETEDLSAEDEKRLRKKLRRFRRQAEDMKIDIRAWERLHNLSRYSA
jgi:hypothetical protein